MWFYFSETTAEACKSPKQLQSTNKAFLRTCELINQLVNICNRGRKVATREKGTSWRTKPKPSSNTQSWLRLFSPTKATGIGPETTFMPEFNPQMQTDYRNQNVKLWSTAVNHCTPSWTHQQVIGRNLTQSKNPGTLCRLRRKLNCQLQKWRWLIWICINTPTKHCWKIWFYERSCNRTRSRRWTNLTTATRKVTPKSNATRTACCRRDNCQLQKLSGKENRLKRHLKPLSSLSNKPESRWNDK